MQRATLDLWVGLFVIAGVGALVVLALKVGNLGSFGTAETYIVYSEFDNIGGLKTRAPVKSAGVVVGRVDTILNMSFGMLGINSAVVVGRPRA